MIWEMQKHNVIYSPAHFLLSLISPILYFSEYCNVPDVSGGALCLRWGWAPPLKHATGNVVHMRQYLPRSSSQHQMKEYNLEDVCKPWWPGCRSTACFPAVCPVHIETWDVAAGDTKLSDLFISETTRAEDTLSSCYCHTLHSASKYTH